MEMDWIRLIVLSGKVTGWRYILVVINYFLQFILTRKYGIADLEVVYNFSLYFFTPVLGFLVCFIHNNDLYSYGARIITFFNLHGTTQNCASISHLFFIHLVEKNVQLVISQIRK